MSGWYWLSFADNGLPKGEQFLGVCMVEAHSPVDAVVVAHDLGVNPGGEVQIFALPADYAPPASHANRLLDRAEAERIAETGDER